MTPGSGGLKTATFQIGYPTAACTVTFTDKKGNTATLQVIVSADGADCV